MEMEEIDLRELFLVLLKRIKMIISITILAALASGLISFFVLKPSYETFTTLMLSKPSNYNEQIEYNDVMLNQKLVKTYGEIAKSRIVSTEVIKKLGLDITPEEFGGKINVSLVQDTEIIKISATDSDPRLAMDIANETADVFIDNVENIMNVENVKIIDEAQLPQSPVKPNKVLNIAIAGVLGLMVSIFIAFLREYLDNTVKTPSDIEKGLDLPVIGMIPNFDND